MYAWSSMLCPISSGHTLPSALLFLAKRNFNFHLIWKHSFNGPRSGRRKCSPGDQSSSPGKCSEMTLSLLGVSDAYFGERGPEGRGEALSFPRREGALQGAQLARSSPLLGDFGHLMFPIHSSLPPAPPWRERQGRMVLDASPTWA